MRSLVVRGVRCGILLALATGGCGDGSSGGQTPVDAGPDGPGVGGGGGGGAGAGGAGGAAGMGGATGMAMAKPGVRVLPDDGSVTIVSAAGGSLSLRGTVPALKAGDVIVSRQAGGVARKVVAVAPNGAETVVTTEPASLGDIFHQADFQVRRAYTAADVIMRPPPPEEPDGEPTAPGAPLAARVVTPGGTAERRAGFALPFDSKWYEDQVRLQGTMNLSFEVDVRVVISPSSGTKVHVKPTIGGNLDATFESDLRGVVVGDPRLAILELAPMEVPVPVRFEASPGVFTMTDIPITIWPKLDLVAVVSVMSRPGTRLGMKADMTAMPAFEWSPGMPWKPLPDHSLGATMSVSAVEDVSGGIGFRPIVTIKAPEMEVEAIKTWGDLPQYSFSVNYDPAQSMLSTRASARIWASARVNPKPFVPTGDLMPMSAKLFESPALQLLATSAKAHHFTADFSKTANPNGVWTYGWAPALGGDFTPYGPTPNMTEGIVAWTDASRGSELSVYSNTTAEVLHPAGTVTLQPGQVALHPGPQHEVSVARFTPTVAGRYRVTASFQGASGHGGAPLTSTAVTLGLGTAAAGDVKGKVATQVQGGTANLNQDGQGNRKSFDVELMLSPATPLDFVVGDNGSHLYDTTALTAVITLLP